MAQGGEERVEWVGNLWGCSLGNTVRFKGGLGQGRKGRAQGRAGRDKAGQGAKA